MPTVIIKSIKHQNILSYEDYEWIKAHLNKQLKLFSVDYLSSGKILSIAVRKGNEIILLFKDSNGIEFTIKGVDRRY